ncbi:MAG: DEAD/DEAH box helicase [Bacteroidota bacterium]
MANLTLRQLKNSFNESWLKNDYLNLLLDGDTIQEDDSLIKLLKTAIVFVQYGDDHLSKLGYRIITRYSNKYNDYVPLFDIAINKGYIPISKFIESTEFNDERYSDTLLGAFNTTVHENFRYNEIYISHGQKKLIDFAASAVKDYVIVAPTSYGKSEIIIGEINKNRDSNTVVIVPTKALLAQTKKRIVESSAFKDNYQKIITHPEMFRGNEKNFIAVLTQERLLRLLQRHGDLNIDLVLIDEAHNLLSSDSRAVLLAQVILILKKRNSDSVIKFFTPFISDAKNLQIPLANYTVEEGKSNENLKTERFYVCDLRFDRKLYLYDQFISDFFQVKNDGYRDELECVKERKGNKNIIYLNRPRDIESFAMKMTISSTTTNQIDTQLNEAYDAIADYVHPEYNLLKCIKSGVVYHHGGMPELVRLYVESIFSKIPYLRFIVTSSTLLEGVNIPAEKIFLLSNKVGRRSFSKSQFKNLIGRVCRFSEIFDSEKGNLNLLEPEIYLFKGEYTASNANIRNFIKDRARIDLKMEDRVDNILMKSVQDDLSPQQIEQLEESLTYLENIENNVIDENQEIRYAKYQISESCFHNNIHDFDILDNEDQLNENLLFFKEQTDKLIDNSNDLLQAIFMIFIDEIEIKDETLKRLEYQAARSFYSMFIDWRINGSSYNQMISSFTRYWDNLDNKIIYVGSKWGEIKLNDQNVRELYVDLETKNESQQINLSIVRIKEEQDFVDNTLMKYVEVLADLELMNDDFYDKVKYGTSDKQIITLLKNGFSMDLAKIIVQRVYSGFVEINIESDEVIINEQILEVMRNEGVNEILIFELNYHISIQ